jgi:hypothetical protein
VKEGRKKKEGALAAVLSRLRRIGTPGIDPIKELAFTKRILGGADDC